MASSVDGSHYKSDAVQAIFLALVAGETRALARAVSIVENGAAEAAPLLAHCREAVAESGKSRTRSFRVGITGPAGAGKSTLVDALTHALRSRGCRVGIVAVDPSSSFSGGAILGDRIRLGEFTGDAGVFMRSMATRGHLGGLAAATDDVLTVMETAGFEWLLVETTGVGQGEIEVVGLADAVAVVLVPGMGDSIQSLKAGVLEIASVSVLNKADREGVDRLEGEIGEMLGLSALVSGGTKAGPPVVKTVATSGEGVAELLTVLEFMEKNRADATEHSRAISPLGRDKLVPVEISVPILGAVLDHLGIAVRSLSSSLGLYQALGAAVSGAEEVAQERVRVAMLAVGESRIELLEATQPDSVIGRFVEKRGEGLHHIALRVPDLQASVEQLKKMGVRLVSDQIQIGAGGHRYVFIHPSSANGVLLELVETVTSGEAH
jgi:LAO/AO transport system kinase